MSLSHKVSYGNCLPFSIGGSSRSSRGRPRTRQRRRQGWSVKYERPHPGLASSPAMGQPRLSAKLIALSPGVVQGRARESDQGASVVGSRMRSEMQGLDQGPLRPVIRRRASARPGARLSFRWALDAHFVAVLLGTLAALGLIGATLSVIVDLFVAPCRLYTSDLEESLHLLASVIGLAGAFRLARGAHQAKHTILVGLGLNVAATLLLGR